MEELAKLNNDFTLFGVMVDDPWATLISLAVIVISGLVGLRILLAVTRKIQKRSNHLDDMLHVFVLNVVKVAGVIILIALCLDKLGVNMGTIVAVIGAAGAAVALALRDSLANVAGGLMIIITQPFRQGDLINVGEYRGRVQSIDLFLTTLRTLDYKVITVPNGIINTSILVNESREEIRRVDLEFGISYDSDVQRALAIMLEICHQASMILQDPPPSGGIRRQDDSAVVLELFAWCRTEDYFETGYYLKEQVKLAFDREGIEIPYPHLDVAMR